MLTPHKEVCSIRSIERQHSKDNLENVMKTFIINSKYLLCAENEFVARNLAECYYSFDVITVEAM